MLTIQKNDILCGKNKAFGHHVGNQLFRELVHSYKDVYMRSCSKNAKMMLTKEICTVIKRKYGSRFVRIGKNGEWEEISEQLARDKVSHALRFAAKAGHGTTKTTTSNSSKRASSLTSTTTTTTSTCICGGSSCGVEAATAVSLCSSTTASTASAEEEEPEAVPSSATTTLSHLHHDDALLESFENDYFFDLKQACPPVLPLLEELDTLNTLDLDRLFNEKTATGDDRAWEEAVNYITTSSQVEV